MRTAATRSIQYTAPAPVLYLAFDHGLTRWVLAFSTGLGQPARLRAVPARDLRALAQEIRQAKRRFGLPGEAGVVSCYEAGRDGFWLHRALTAVGIQKRGS